MTRRSGPRSPPRPIGAARLDELALAYVARFATSEAKLGRYLARKLFERGWDGPGTVPDAVSAAVERCVRLGFVDDGEYARMRAGALTRRGLGERRVRAQLGADGIDAAMAAPVLDTAREGRLATALAFARRRRLGPFGNGTPADAKARDKMLAAFLRGGHDAGVARRIMAIAPGDEAGLAELEAEANDTASGPLSILHP
jgi:regulatory protein